MLDFGRALRANLNAGARLARGAPPASLGFDCSMAQVFGVLVLGWLLAVVEQRIAAGAEARFWIWGWSAEAAKAYLWLLTAGLIAWLGRRPAAVPLVIVALGWSSIPVWMVAVATQQAASLWVGELEARWARLFWAGLFGWQCAILWRVCAVVGGFTWWRRGLATALYAAALYAMVAVVPAESMFYREAELAPALDVEATYYAQHGLLAQQLDALPAQDPSAIDFYFVAAGAYAGEDVFMREVQQARVIAERELGLRGKVVTLINNPATLGSVALANRHNLARALAGVAARMDRDQDVLLLYLTSHGGEDARIAVEFGPLGLNDLHASELRAMLDDAGILWRVVIVSACYSGSFVEPLSSPTTIVMTAAAAERSSFGCGYGFAWTYFGEAFFTDALRHTADLIDAFARAKASIARREAAEGKPPSEPQIAVGARIAAHLDGWQPPRELSRRTACAGSRSRSCRPP